LKINSKGLY